MIQVIYSNSQKEIRFRKAVGVDDASGDYNTYDTFVTEKLDDYDVTTYDASITEALDGYNVTLKGTDGKFNLAIRTTEEYAYSVSSSDTLSEEDMTELEKSVVFANALLEGDSATPAFVSNSAN